MAACLIAYRRMRSRPEALLALAPMEHAIFKRWLGVKVRLWSATVLSNRSISTCGIHVWWLAARGWTQIVPSRHPGSGLLIARRRLIAIEGF